MSNRNGIHHVVRGAVQFGPNTSYCGRNVWNMDAPIELDHAKSCIEKETYLQPCKRCMAKANKEQMVKV